MASLTTQQLQEVRSLLQEEFSSILEEIPITKSEAQQLLNLIDTQVEAAELAIFAAIPVGPGRTWLQGNQPIGRRFIEAIVAKRKETL